MNNHRRGEAAPGLPLWLTVTVVLWLMAVISYCVIRFGLDGYPMVMFFGALLGGYAGLDRAVRRARQNGHEDEQQAGGGPP